MAAAKSEAMPKVCGTDRANPADLKEIYMKQIKTFPSIIHVRVIDSDGRDDDFLSASSDGITVLLGDDDTAKIAIYKRVGVLLTNKTMPNTKSTKSIKTR